MEVRVVFKRHLTPIGRKGKIIKQRGKGSIQQDQTQPGGETVTGGDPMQRMKNQYPKPPPPVPRPAPAPDQAEYDEQTE